MKGNRIESPEVITACEPSLLPLTAGQGDAGEMSDHSPEPNGFGTLSPIQEGMLFHTLLAPNSGVYHQQVVLTLRGELEVAALVSAWDQVVRQHESLRISFLWEGLEKPMLVISPQVVLPWEFLDWREVAVGEQGRRLESSLAEDRRKGFDLSQAPLMRFALIRVGNERHELVWSFHNSLMDGESVSLVIRNLAARYEATCEGVELPLENAPPYRDYLDWLREERRLDVEAFWRSSLQGFGAPTSLAVDSRDRDGLHQPVASAHRLSTSWSRAETAALQAFAARHRLGFSTLLQGAWAMLLSRYSGEEDVVFGSTLSVRPSLWPGAESLVGLYVNTVPVRVRALPEASALSCLLSLGDQLAKLRRYYSSPLNEILGWSEIPRDKQLFESLVACEERAWPPELAPRLAIENLTSYEQTNYPLVLKFQLGEQLRLQVTFATPRLDDSAIARLVGHLRTLLGNIAADTDQAMGKLPLLTSAEWHQLVVEPNQSRGDCSRSACLHELFEAQVEQTPEAVGLVFEQERLTYRVLNSRANQLAHYLRGHGVGPDVLVGIHLDRSAELVVAVLAILKAGGAYVPLDPAYPQARKRFMLEDSKTSLLLTQQRLLADFGEGAWRPNTICLDRETEAIETTPKSNPTAGARPDNLAYVIYTSGSTGQPKGVPITHHNVVRLFGATNAWFRFGQQDVWTLFHSIAFDFSVWELWGALLYGGRLVVVPYLTSRAPNLFYDLLQRERVTVLNQTPSAFRQLVLLEESMPTPKDLALRLVIFGGEALEFSSLRSWFDRHGDERPELVNMYGITETTVHVTYRPVKRSDLNKGSLIGLPIPDLQLYILDRFLQPTPVGVIGEMCVGGEGVARGYLGRPDLTAAKFIPNPFSEIKGSRLYRSGDLARYRPDGDIEYLGRLDHQVKIRGFRIELGEIEAALRLCRGVVDCVVLARESAEGDRRLVAYLVTKGGEVLTFLDLREQLKTRLPDYMLPAAFVVLERLPLTPNGKVDRKALPAPEADGPLRRDHHVGPRTPQEEVLAGIWSEILGVKQVGVQDSFFDLGGHSLLATRLMSRIRKSFGVELPLRVLFEAPSIAGLVQQIDQGLGVGNSRLAPTIVSRGRTQALPLSFAQERLWFLEQLEPGSCAYLMPLALRLVGTLDQAALERSLGEIVRRHEVLRTAYRVEGENPVQVVVPWMAESLVVSDLRGMDGEAQSEAVQALAREEVRHPFDLRQGPMLRAKLARLGEAEHVLLMTLHHIACDGWSLGILARELAVLYQACAGGVSSPLSPLAVQYADFAVWQREWLRGEVLERQLAFWRRQLGGALPVVELPTDRPRPAVQTYRGAQQSVVLPKVLMEKLRQLSRQEQVTPFMTLLAAFQVLLQRYTGQEEVVVGSPIANRNREEVEGLIGFFVNTLVLRSDLSGQPTFRELLVRVREVCWGAYAHQDVPFERLVQELHPERRLDRHPLFQVMFAMQSAQETSWKLAGLEVHPLEEAEGNVRFEMEVHCWEVEEGLRCVWIYNTDLFERVTIVRMMGHFRRLLEGIAENPEQPIGKLPLLTEGERQQLVVEWNQTRREYPREACIHELFEAQVERTPEAVALESQGRRLSYRELNGRANQLAHYLRGMGVGPEVLVGICMERSVEMVVGLLGILKAGGAYIPLDPAYPQARRRYMMEDASAPFLLTEHQLVPDVGWEPTECKIVHLDLTSEIIAREPTTNRSCGVGPDNLAYVIYTSGSTGQPKGVAIEHRSPVNLVHWALEHFSEQECAGVVFGTSVCFDLSIFELFVPLSLGGKVILVENVLMLPNVGVSGGVTLLNTVPSVVKELLGRGTVLGSLRTINLAGEPLNRDLVEKLHQLPGSRNVHDLYGPTETTTYSTWALRSAKGPNTIGRPIANTQVYILDEGLQPVPVGVPGQIYIGGDGLARGYLNRPELTREKFIADPFSDKPRSRLYKTGDLARYLPDGDIEFLGRMDHQVKVRGFRVELGEIESVLRQCDGVAECVVVAWQEAGEDKRLVGYLVPKSGETLEVSDLRRELKDRLPDYMLPSAFVVLERLPLTPNGKVDRKALPTPEADGPLRRDHYVAPRTPQEEVLAGIWSEILGVKQVGVQDSFFDLGGHSLLATRLMSRIRKSFGVELPLRVLFEAPSIAGLVQQIDQGLGVGNSRLAPTIVSRGRTQALPLSFAQERLWFLEQLEPGSCAYLMPLPLRLVGTLDQAALEWSLGEIVRRHEVLRTAYRVEGESPVQVIVPWKAESLVVLDLRGMDGEAQSEAVQALAREEVRRPFDLRQGPMLRAKLARLGEAEHVLLMTLHHIACDGWSLGILARELAVLYQACAGGVSSPLSPLAVQYADFAVWQREWLRGEVLERQLAFWRRQLGGALPVVELPTDRPRPAVQTYRGAQQSVFLPKALMEKVRQLSRQEQVTPFMTLLAAFQVLLQRYSGQEEVVVGSPTTNRNREEVEGLIGFFVNTLVLRSDLSGQPTFRELLARVREVCWGAYAHQDVPFERLVQELHPERRLDRHPLFQVMFAMQSAQETSWKLAGLEVHPLEEAEGNVRFEMEVHCWELEEGLRCVWIYNTDLFERATIGRMMGHFRRLLEGIAENPEQPIGKLPLLTEAEWHQLVVERNQTEAEFPVHLCVDDLFEQQVGRNPERVAVVFKGQQLTYQELDVLSSGLALYLRGLGVGPDVLVGLFVERSLDMVVGLLGVLKAGGAYVPLDPHFPKERLAFMVEDAKPLILLTQQRLEPQLPRHQSQVVCLDSDFAAAIGSRCEGVVACKRHASDLAYVLYTSGSTGQPKGVQVSHGAVVNCLYSMRQEPGMSAQDVLLAVTTLSFDIALLELLLPLVCGARTVIAEDGIALDGGRLLSLLEESGATVMQATPASWRLLLEAGWPGSPGLKILCGGEGWGGDLAHELLSRCNSLWNVYGPTESTIWSSVLRVREGQQVLIGPPISNTAFYVVDRYGQISPIGVPGELWIGGAGLARGYLNRPELTKERFLPDAFGAKPGVRVYKTGDLVRYLPDGNIEFLGRLDHQVKIRGFRIELGEIESVIRGCLGVSECVVVVREVVAGDKRLVVYLVAKAGETLHVSDVRERLKAKLPDYMLPSAFVVLERLPLTPNGKVDRKSLPPPDAGGQLGREQYEAPRTPTETALARIWEELLGANQVGRQDSFFDLGGHSLLAVRLRALLEARFDRRFPLAALFRYSRLGELAALVEQSDSFPEMLNPAVITQGSPPPLFWFQFFDSARRLSRHLEGKCAVHTIETYLNDGLRHWCQRREVSITLEELARQCLAQLRAVQGQGPYYLAGYCFAGFVAFEVASQLVALGERVELLAVLEADYLPGCRRLSVPWLRRWIYHARKLNAGGLNYLRTRWRQRTDRDQRRSAERKMVYRGNYQEAALEEAALLQNEFLGRILAEYRARPYPGKAVLFRATARTPCFDHDLGTTCGWQEIVQGGVLVEEIECNHEQIAKGPHLQEVARRLMPYLPNCARSAKEGLQGDGTPTGSR